jgi:uncharacterized membrane protein
MSTSTMARTDAVSARSLGVVRDHAWVLAVWAAMLTWSLLLFLVVRDHYLKFRLARFDLGNMVQAVWSTAHGRPLEMTEGVTGEQITRLGSHADPILALLAPAWIAAPTPLTLAAVQIGAVALGALPVYWLARRHSGSERTAGLLAVAYLVYPWTAWTAVDVFHPVTLAVPLYLFCVWFLDNDRLVPFAMCAALAMATGELMALPIAALGIWYALARGRRITGAVIALVGVSWSAVALLVVVPAFSGDSSAFYGAYREVGSSPEGIVRTALTDPVTILSAATRGSDLLYLALLAVPLAGAFLLAPALAAVALPQLAANLLAGFTATTDPHAHYIAGILPFLFAAIAVGLGRLDPTRRLRTVVLVLTLSAAASIMVGPWPGAIGGKPGWYETDASKERIAALNDAVELVPAGAPVSSTNRIGSHLSARRRVYSVPAVGQAEWIVLDSSDAWIPKNIGGYPDMVALQAFREHIEQSPNWRKVFDAEDVLVFQRVNA